MNAPLRLFNDLAGIDIRVKVLNVGASPLDDAPPYASMLARGHAEVVGFEPNLGALSILNDAKGPYETYLPYAVGDGQQHILHFCHAPGMTSLLEPDPAVLDMFNGFPHWGRVVDRQPIHTVRLDDVPEAQGADMIKIDIQGAELLALRHAVDRLRDVVVVQTEVEFLPIYKGQPLFSEVEQFLRSQGFLFHRFFPLVSRTFQPVSVGDDMLRGLSQQVWADGIFVRDFIHFSGYSDRQLLAGAAVLHNCYGSIDLAHRLAQEYDRRQGTQVAFSYFDGFGRQFHG